MGIFFSFSVIPNVQTCPEQAAMRPSLDRAMAAMPTLQGKIKNDS